MCAEKTTEPTKKAAARAADVYSLSAMVDRYAKLYVNALGAAPRPTPRREPRQVARR